MIDRFADLSHITTVSGICFTVSGICFEACEIQRTAGCSINHGYVVTDGTRRFFTATNRADRYSMFENETGSLSAPAAIFRWV